MLNREDRDKIVELLNDKIPNISCPMCKNKQFIIADGYFVNSIQTDFNSIIIGGDFIPTIPVICNNCGFISQHSLGVLGLISNNTDKKTNNE